jgi:hypothetical protein
LTQHLWGFEALGLGVWVSKRIFALTELGFGSLTRLLHLLIKVRLPLETLQHLRLEFSHLLIQLGQRFGSLFLFTFLLLLELFALAPIAEKYRNASQKDCAARENVCLIHGEFVLLGSSSFACVLL